MGGPPQMGYGSGGGLENQMVQGFANMNMGMSTMTSSKPRGRGGQRGGGDRRGGGGYGGGERGGGHTRERDSKKGEEITKEMQTGRDLAKMCNPELK